MPICDEECQRKERHALLELYGSLGGRNWIHKWDIEANGTALNTLFHCDWYGILCDSRTKHIMDIYLSQNNLQGMLPVNLTNLQFLFSFSIGYNPVSGQFEKIVASMPKHLVNLEVSHSKISGRIPQDIVNYVPILSKLKLHGSSLSGEIPEAIGDLIHLTVLNLGETEINGSIPQSISRLKNLWYLDLETLRLKGNLSFLYNLRELRQLHLLSNEISGPIPESIGEMCPNLIELRLPNNKLSGHLPRSLGMLNKLQILSIEKNNLSGPLPAYLFKLNLKVIVLSSNKFTGFEIGSNATFTGLQVFRASNLPAFNCSIDIIVSSLKGSVKTIMLIDVSHSNIYGQIPASIFSFRFVTIIKLTSNLLTGPIPAPWQNLPFLTVLDLQDNDLYGPIPMSFSSLLMLTEFNLRGNQRLRGPVSSFMVLDYEMKVKERLSDICPMVRFAHNNGTVHVDSSYYNRKFCYCASQYFGNGIHCKSCLQGGSCPGIPTTVFAMKELTEDQVKLPASAMFLKQGYYPFPSESDVKSIHKCPELDYNDRICVPGKECGCYVNTKEERIDIVGPVVTTLNRTKIYCNTSCLCRQGHHGRFCSQCIKGYYKDGLHCYKCYSKSREPGVVLAYVLGTVALFVVPICVYSFVKQQRYSLIAAVAEIIVTVILYSANVTTPFFLNVSLVFFFLFSYSRFESCTALFGSAMFYSQVMSSLIATTDIWPQWIHILQAVVVSTFNFRFSSLGCSFPMLSTPVAENMVLLLAPFICIGLVWLAHFVIKRIEHLPCRCGGNNDLSGHMEKFSVDNCARYSLSILDFAYFPIAESSLAVFNGCNNIDGVSFLKEFPWINCSSSEYDALLAIAVIHILYIFILPSGLFLYVCYIKSDSTTSSNDDIWYVSFLAQYTEKCGHYKYLYYVLRRLSIAFVMAWLRTYPSLLTSISTLLLLLCISFQFIARPFKSPSENQPSETPFDLENIVDISMLSALEISIVCAEFSAGNENWVQSTLLALIYVTNISFLVIIFFCVVYRLRDELCKNRQGANSAGQQYEAASRT